MRLRSAAVASLFAVVVTGAPSLAAPAPPSIRPNPNPVVQTDSSFIAFAMLGRRLPANTSYTLFSPGLDAACAANNLSGDTATADFTGRFNSAHVAEDCNAGRYQIIATQNEAPFRQYVSFLRILPPRDRPGPLFRTIPNPVTQDTNGDVAFTVQGQGLPALTNYQLLSPGLESACSANSLDGAFLQADFNGNIVYSADANGCAPGTYSIVAAQQEAPFRSYNTSVTIRSPSTFNKMA